ncbi:phenol hydroxylase [Xanthomonas oryzae pv. oryzae KACC 10331]|uniref:Phenol hydroxylase n=1 Tax=Xanthomonas oryzae pv. oryzae (strain KACC10331 / KXO85) TaxID=291331 RepID=Q5H5Y6_XANOR|nr:phenol hydroxylase [Xanthomonas oryzae pv. oryzae KACC 10331]
MLRAWRTSTAPKDSWVACRARGHRCGRGRGGRTLAWPGQTNEQFFQPVALGAHRAHADAGIAQGGEHAVEVHRARHVQVQRVAVDGGERGAFDRRQLRGQLTVDIEQEAFHIEFGQQFAHRPMGDDLAVVDDGQVAAQVLGFFQVMRGQDDGGAGGVDVLEHAPHVAADFDVHTGGGFVQDQQARLGHHGAGDHQPALHAAGERAAHHLGLFPQVRAAQFHFGQRLGLTARHAVETSVIDQDVEGFFEQVEVDFLRHQADQAHRIAAVAGQVGTEHFHLPAGQVHQRADDADQGGFAGPVGAEQGEEIAWHDVQRHALERLGAVVVGLAQIAHAQGGRTGRG